MEPTRVDALSEVPLCVNSVYSAWKNSQRMTASRQFQCVLHPLTRADIRLAVMLGLAVFLLAAAFPRADVVLGR